MRCVCVCNCAYSMHAFLCLENCKCVRQTMLNAKVKWVWALFFLTCVIYFSCGAWTHIINSKWLWYTTTDFPSMSKLLSPLHNMHETKREQKKIHKVHRKRNSNRNRSTTYDWVHPTFTAFYTVHIFFSLLCSVFSFFIQYYIFICASCVFVFVCEIWILKPCISC